MVVGPGVVLPGLDLPDTDIEQGVDIGLDLPGWERDIPEADIPALLDQLGLDADPPGLDQDLDVQGDLPGLEHDLSDIERGRQDPVLPPGLRDITQLQATAG
jgi:hypothetical protein